MGLLLTLCPQQTRTGFNACNTKAKIYTFCLVRFGLFGLMSGVSLLFLINPE